MGSEKNIIHQENQKDSTEVKLSMAKKIGYGLGEAGSTLSFTMISSYLTVFYSDVVGLAPAVISIIMLIARIWQAICDPVFGGIAENTRSKFGRYRPYILYGAPVLALFNCLTFLNLDIPNSAKAIWCAVTYIVCCTAYSVANGAVTCIVNSLTSINTERVSANAVKGIVSSVFGIIVSAVTMPLIMKFGGGNTNSARGYFYTALVFSVASNSMFFYLL
ncbi:MFS transporter [Blautia wexlerae]|nr:MFS transporter [Blautia wexlerae]